MRGWKLGSVAGIAIEINYTWVFVFLLLVMGLGYEMQQIEGALPAWQGQLAGLVAAVLLFSSVLFHELAHSVAARWYGMEVSRITLFIFGGVAQTKGEPPTGMAEMVVAGLGPLASVFLGGVFLGLAWLLQSPPVDLNPLLAAVAHRVGIINLWLAAFNLVPAFPLDGGRLLRASLWAWRGDLVRATRVASSLGQFFGYVLMGLGVHRTFSSGLINGFWFLGLGWLLTQAARQAYQSTRLREMLRSLPVYRAMQPVDSALEAGLSVWHAVHEHLAPRRLEVAPVAERGVLVGVLSAENIRRLPETEWPYLPVSQVMIPLDVERMIINQGADLGEALDKFAGDEVRQLLVVDGEGRLTGLLTQQDLVNAARLLSQGR
jgi:Zn-dependent protease